MQARRVHQDSVKKPKPSSKSAQCRLIEFSYDASPSGVDSNLLILTHGLGDSHLPFQSLGKKLASNLPQTAILSLRGGAPVPFLDTAGWSWWEVWDSLGQEITHPDLSGFLSAFKNLLNHLTKKESEGGCGWPATSIHLFGFAQGGTAALEGAIAWIRERRSDAKIDTSSKTIELGSITSVCASLLSHPTFSPPLSTPVLWFHREADGASSFKSKSNSLRKAFTNVHEARFPSHDVEAMPRSQAEWTSIMKFWSSVVRNRNSWELEGSIYSINDTSAAQPPTSVEETASVTPSAMPSSSSIGWSPTAEEKAASRPDA